MMYMLGDDVERSYENAFLNSSKGALLGDGLAQRSLAKMYSEGLGCDKDSTLAVYWIKKAATRHNVFQHHAQYELGMWYWEGNHVAENKTIGMSWLLSSATGSLPDALIMLGIIFEEGQGNNDKNPIRAAFFFEQAVREDEPEGYFRLGKLHCTHDQAGNPGVDEEESPEWADFAYGIEILTHCVHRGHGDGIALLEETLELVAARYDTPEQFRARIQRGVTEEDELCIAIDMALGALALYAEEQQQGLSEEAIDALPSETLDKRVSNCRCCICLADFEKDEEIRKLGCNHMFHKTCVDEWLRRNHSCPLCKNTVEPPAPSNSPSNPPETMTPPPDIVG